MQANRIFIATIITSVLACASWIGAICIDREVSAQIANDRDSGPEQMQTDDAKMNAARLHRAMQKTLVDRTRLREEILPSDVVVIANAIDSLGKKADVTMKIGAATPADSPGSGVNAIQFMVQADGTFDNIMRAAMLCENLPFPSTLKQVDIEELPASALQTTGQKALWRLTVRMLVYTTSDITS